MLLPVRNRILSVRAVEEARQNLIEAVEGFFEVASPSEIRRRLKREIYVLPIMPVIPSSWRNLAFNSHLQEVNMNVMEIEKAIQLLSAEEFSSLMFWIAEYRNEKWDRQIGEDYKALKLDKLISSALIGIPGNQHPKTSTQYPAPRTKLRVSL